MGALSRTQAHEIDLVALLTGLKEVQYRYRSLLLGCLWFLGCWGGALWAGEQGWAGLGFREGMCESEDGGNRCRDTQPFDV